MSNDDFFYPVLGPGWLDHFVWNEYYKTEEEYCYALAEIVKNDFKAVVDAGFVLQIDDPGLCDRWGMIEPDPAYEEYRRQENDAHRGDELGAGGHPGGPGALPHLLGQLAHAAHHRHPVRARDRPDAAR